MTDQNGNIGFVGYNPFSAAEGIAYMPSISVVIPTRNEAKNLPYVIPHVPDWVHEIIIVDGNSTDNTIEVALSLSNKIRIVRQIGKGKGNALIAGFKAADGDIIVMLDADGSTDPAEIQMYIAPLLAGWHFTKGSRYMQGGDTVDISAHRSMGNLALLQLVRLFFGSKYTDLCYGYSAFWTWTLDYLLPDVDGFEIETLINIRAIRANLRVAEVPSFEKERIYGESNLNAIRDGIRILKVILRERFMGRSIPVYNEAQQDKNGQAGTSKAISPFSVPIVMFQVTSD